MATILSFTVRMFLRPADKCTTAAGKKDVFWDLIHPNSWFIWKEETIKPPTRTATVKKNWQYQVLVMMGSNGNFHMLIVGV